LQGPRGSTLADAGPTRSTHSAGGTHSGTVDMQGGAAGRLLLVAEGPDGNGSDGEAGEAIDSRDGGVRGELPAAGALQPAQPSAVAAQAAAPLAAAPAHSFDALVRPRAVLAFAMCTVGKFFALLVFLLSYRTFV
jgi:hypothetical protein